MFVVTSSWCRKNARPGREVNVSDWIYRRAAVAALIGAGIGASASCTLNPQSEPPGSFCTGPACGKTVSTGAGGGQGTSGSASGGTNGIAVGSSVPTESQDSGAAMVSPACDNDPSCCSHVDAQASDSGSTVEGGVRCALTPDAAADAGTDSARSTGVSELPCAVVSVGGGTSGTGGLR